MTADFTSALWKRGEGIDIDSFPVDFEKLQLIKIGTTKDNNEKALLLYELGCYYSVHDQINEAEIALLDGLKYARRAKNKPVQMDIRRRLLNNIYGCIFNTLQQTNSDNAAFFIEFSKQLSIAVGLLNRKPVDHDGIIILTYNLCMQMFHIVSITIIRSEEMRATIRRAQIILFRLIDQQALLSKTELKPEILELREKSKRIIQLIDTIYKSQVEFNRLTR